MTYRLIALDVDGTLINDHHELTPRVRDAVRAAEAQGAEIVLCTGRGSTSTLPVLKELGLEGILITHNGASIVESKTRKIVAEKAIPFEPATKYIQFAKQHGVHYDLNTAFELYVNGEMTAEIADMYARYLAQPIVRTEEEGLPQGLVKLSLYAPKSTLDALEASWNDWNHELQTIRSGDYFIDVQHPQASKGDALRQYAELRGVPREQVLAIGNYYNDLGMIRFAGLGVAMDNSPDDVKAAADAATASNNEDGVALVLEKYVLG